MAICEKCNTDTKLFKVSDKKFCIKCKRWVCKLKNKLIKKNPGLLYNETELKKRLVEMIENEETEN